MKKALLCVLMVTLFSGGSWVSAKKTMDAIHLPVGILTVSAPRGVTPLRSPVTFPHSLHFDYSCKTCHHTWDGLTPVKNCATSGCHDQVVLRKDKEGKVASSTPEIRYFRDAYHQNCITCHKRLDIKRRQLEKSGSVLKNPLPRTGPTGCIGCHPRNQ